MQAIMESIFDVAYLLVAIILCLFPQNDWLSADSPCTLLTS